MPTQSTLRRQAWFATIEKYIASGQSQTLFCQTEQINYGTFHYWLKKYRQANADAGCGDQAQHSFVPLSFASVEPSVQDQHYTIEYDTGVVLHINCPIDSQLLIQLIRAQG